MDEKSSENNQVQADGGDESNSSEVGVIGSTIWAISEIRGGNDANISVFLCLLNTNDTVFILNYFKHMFIYWYILSYRP